jgi:hypothetical protein
MADPVSRGVALVKRKAPTFSKFIVVKGSWKEAPVLDVEETEDGNSETRLIEGVNPGIDAECEWVVKSGETSAAHLDVVLATYADESTTEKFVVIEPPQYERSGRRIKQTVKLKQRDSLDADLTETDP